MIHIVLGTKAQLIKMVPIMIRLRDKKIPYNFIFTGQHQNTMKEMLSDFNLKKPDVVLYDGPDIVSIKKMFFWAIRILWLSLINKKKIFQNDIDGIVLVHGDTLSTLLGAISGRLAGLQVGHVESGLRSFNIFHPFPEEIIRLLTFRLCHILFCPGQWAVQNVRHLKCKIVDIKANTMKDTLNIAKQVKRRRDHIPSKPYAIVSIHRYENVFKREKLNELVGILNSIGLRYPLVFILHKPTEKQLLAHNLLEQLQENTNIELRNRYVYFDFLTLLEQAEFIITDGGSLQEETSYLGIPCLLLRKATERPEGINRNVVLSEYDKTTIDNFIDNYKSYRKKPVSSLSGPSDLIIETLIKLTST